MGQCCGSSRKPFSVFSHQNTASIFAEFDTNGNGQLETTELKSFLKEAFPGVELTDQELDELVTEIDTDKSGTIGLNELHAFLRCYDPSSKTVKRKTALVVIDVQNDFISGSLAVETSDSIVTVINQIRDEFDHVVISYDWHPHDHCSFVESANDGKVKIKETENIGTLAAFSQVTLLEDDDRGEHMQMLYPRHAVQNLSTRVSQACELEITTCRLNIFKTLNGTRILVVISLASFARKTWGGECHKDLIVKPEDMSVYKGQKHNIDSYSAFFDNCKANDTGLTKQLEDAGVTDVYCCGLVFDICVKSSALHGAEMGFRVSVIEDACKPLNEKDVEPTKSVLHEAGVRVLSARAAAEEVKQIKGAGNLAVRDYIQSVKPHKRASVLHKAERISSHSRLEA